MSKDTSSRTKAILRPIFCALVGIWVLYSQIQQDAEHRELKMFGQTIVGNLTEATRHSVNFIPTGYSFGISYAGQSKEFEVSKSLFYSHVDADGKFKMNEKIPVIFISLRPTIAELPEMLDLYIWWWGGPLVNYPFAAFLLFVPVISMVSMSNQHKTDTTSPVGRTTRYDLNSNPTASNQENSFAIKSILVIALVGVIVVMCGYLFDEFMPSDKQEEIAADNANDISDKANVIKTDQSAESLATEICDRERVLARCNSLILNGQARSCINLSNDFITQCGEFEQLYPYINTAARRLSDWDVALHAADKIIEFFPYNYNSHWIRGTTYEDKGDFENASKDLFQVLILEPKAIDPPFHLAKILPRLGRPCEAISPLTQFIFHHPDLEKNAKTLISQLYRNPECVSLHGNGSAKIQLNKDGQSITSHASINGYPGNNFIIDTGASSVVLNSKFATKIGLDFKQWPTQMMRTANGDVTAYVGFVDSIEVQGVRANHVEAAVISKLGDIDGLLGLSFLGRFDIKLDVESGYISLNSKGQANEQEYPTQSENDSARNAIARQSNDSYKPIVKSMDCDENKHCVTKFGNSN